MYKLDLKSLSSKNKWVSVSSINWQRFFFYYQTKDHPETQSHKKNQSISYLKKKK